MKNIFRLLLSLKKNKINQKRLDEILKERTENAKIVTRLLEKLKV